MSEENPAPDLFDLKFLPAWVREAPNENRYADFVGEENFAPGQREPRERERREGRRRPRGPRPMRGREGARGPREQKPAREHERRPATTPRPEGARQDQAPSTVLFPEAEVRFVPDARALENVLAQIKAGHLAYSVFSLARMFLDKPERYDVRLKAKSAALFQLGEDGPVSSDRRLLENAAFLNQKDHFYRTEVTQTEPIKGNFVSVARCRLSGMLLGPTNYHAYQPQLRALYEQRFSRRMSFQDYQRQIEIVNDPAVVERWKEEARSVTTYTTLQEDPLITFPNAAETERHFRQAYLPGLLRENLEASVDGVVSRRLPDRSLGRLIENAWAQEFRSPTKMMQELIGAFRHGALHIFRHRKGMLFTSPVRVKPFQHESASVSPSVGAILAALTASPGMNRKQLQEKLDPDEAADPSLAEKRKLALASDLHWLIGEGHVIEFNDGSLDLARAKAPQTSAGAGTKAEPAVPPDESNTPARAMAEAETASSKEDAGSTAADALGVGEPEATELVSQESGHPKAEPKPQAAEFTESAPSENVSRDESEKRAIDQEIPVVD